MQHAPQKSRAGPASPLLGAPRKFALLLARHAHFAHFRSLPSSNGKTVEIKFDFSTIKFTSILRSCFSRMVGDLFLGNDQESPPASPHYSGRGLISRPRWSVAPTPSQTRKSSPQENLATPVRWDPRLVARPSGGTPVWWHARRVGRPSSGMPVWWDPHLVASPSGGTPLGCSPLAQSLVTLSPLLGLSFPRAHLLPP